ncbi:hypothetical protein LguiA_018746 [Lonicera macranthoides]
MAKKLVGSGTQPDRGGYGRDNLGSGTRYQVGVMGTRKLITREGASMGEDLEVKDGGWGPYAHPQTNMLPSLGWTTGFESASSGFDRINYARKIFNDMFIRPVELWNQMITGYVSICDMKSARQVCDGIPKRDVVRVGDVENARALGMNKMKTNFESNFDFDYVVDDRGGVGGSFEVVEKEGD